MVEPFTVDVRRATVVDLDVSKLSTTKSKCSWLGVDVRRSRLQMDVSVGNDRAGSATRYLQASLFSQESGDNKPVLVWKIVVDLSGGKM